LSKNGDNGEKVTQAHLTDLSRFFAIGAML
jgi:hypothetical protein